MNNFANSMRTETTHTFTENGAKARNTSGNCCLDLFGSIGALRCRDEADVQRIFADAYAEDKLLATKILFYARDIREGLGERKVFRDLIKYCAWYHPEVIKSNIDLIPVYGRFDDWYALVETPLEIWMWSAMRRQFIKDLDAYCDNRFSDISLLAKWIKTPDASSKTTRALGIRTSVKIGYLSVRDFKRALRMLRKALDVTEVKMSANEWEKIKYPNVPSRAMMNYRNAFRRHDEERFNSFITKAVNGEEKINSATLYPYDIVEKYLYQNEDTNFDVLEAQWRQLPNYVEEGTNAIVMADVSGSMFGRPLATSIGLAMYFAERNVGAYHNLFMTFSEHPTIINLKGETLYQKIDFLKKANWGFNTNLKSAFEKVLDIAIKNHISSNEMVKSIIVVSDMEIDAAEDLDSSWSFYVDMEQLYKKAGYQIPNVVFWNVDSRNDVFHADSTRQGVQLVSGQSATMFKQLMGCIGMNPVEMMHHVIDSERYSAITIGG